MTQNRNRQSIRTKNDAINISHNVTEQYQARVQKLDNFQIIPENLPFQFYVRGI